jgi:formate hydrogenlyase subunit 3/multisubunit Na+/H+ antiporter MnhD subunit
MEVMVQIMGVFAGIAIALHHTLAKSALFMLADKWGGYFNRQRNQLLPHVGRNCCPP